MARSRTADGPDCNVCTDGSVHEPVHDLLRSLADSDYATLLLAPRPPEIVALVISVYGHLSLARPTVMLSLAVIAAGRTYDC
jgi:hypothetical protein